MTEELINLVDCITLKSISPWLLTVTLRQDKSHVFGKEYQLDKKNP